MNGLHMQENRRKQQHINTRNSCAYAPLILALMVAGCAQQNLIQPGIKVRDSDLYIKADRGIGKGYVMEVTENVLANMYFTIEKADVDAGLIRTRPLPGAQFFEFWRGDNIGADNTLAANLHTIRRTVTLDVSRQNNELRLGCDVHVQRLSLPERQVGSSARVYGMFSTSSPSLQRLQLNPEQKKDMEWIDVGRDPQLEAEILKRIETQIAQRTNHRLQTTENET
jgi:hypothetical protein